MLAQNISISKSIPININPSGYSGLRAPRASNLWLYPQHLLWNTGGPQGNCLNE